MARPRKKVIWTDTKLKRGFERFLKKHDRLPRSHEIDAAPDLPSARAIQLRFGGLVALRERLGYSDTNFSTGTHRSEIAHTVNHRGREVEVIIEQQLVHLFGRRSVYTEKLFHGKCRVDFYVYTQCGAFGVDTFFPGTIRTMQSNVNIKLKKYRHFTPPLFLVVANDLISQEQLDRYVDNRRTPLPQQCHLVTVEQFTKQIQVFTPHPRDTSDNISPTLP